ncbi:MAG: cation diffusion facilitator family transporter [Nitrospiraceae bacterium]
MAHAHHDSHDHSHSHPPGHGHAHAPTHPDLQHRLKAALVMNGLVILAEFLGGWWANSIGVISDAGHNLIDQGALFLALYAHMLAMRPATDARTFGYHRAGIVSALISSVVLLVSAAVMVLWAIRRILDPAPVLGGWMMAIAALAFVANLSVALLLQRGAEHDLNIRSAFWHMLADAWVSLGVVLSGLTIYYTGWTVLDPVMSLLVVGVIVYGAWPILRESIDVLLESTPPHITPSAVIASIERIDGVTRVHDLHIWAVEPRLVILTCHVLVDNDACLTNHLLHTIRTCITAQFGIHHLTVQLETHCTDPDDPDCNLSRLAGTARPHATHVHTHR